MQTIPKNESAVKREEDFQDFKGFKTLIGDSFEEAPKLFVSTSIGAEWMDRFSLASFEKLIWLGARFRPGSVQLARNGEFLSTKLFEEADVLKICCNRVMEGYSIVLNYPEDLDPDLAKYLYAK